VRRRRLVAVAIALAGCVGGAGAGRGAPATARPRDVAALIDDYKAFLDRGRTAALALSHAVAGAGFRAIDPAIEPIGTLAPGDRVVLIDRGRSALFVVVGKRPLVAGSRLIGVHIDTPAPRVVTAGLTRAGQGELRAERYGGFKPYVWVGRPVALVGEVWARGGRRVDVALGFGDDPPLWATATADGLAVRASAATVVPPAGVPRPLVDELLARAGLTAGDLAAAELYVVPREPARDVGLDRAFVGAHGQDDRVDAYAAWRALVDLDRVPERTALVWMTDREEAGASGPTGAASRFLELGLAWLLAGRGEPTTEVALHRAFAAMRAISSDTPACVEPNWPEVHELRHGPLLGRGPVLFPFTGHAGKQGGSAARAEWVAAVDAAFVRAGVALQPGELGAVDEGGGGTIAHDLARRGMEVVDVGVCVASMHSPFEITAKSDVWAIYRGLRRWLQEDTP
jgi:aspartyl aminopeptidase